VKYSDVRRLGLIDIADEVFELICENSVEVPDYPDYVMVDRKTLRRIEDLTEELTRRSRECDRR